MRRPYVNPEIEVVVCEVESSILEVSYGVTSGSRLGNEYNQDDVSYTNERSDYDDIWNLE